MFTKVLVAGGFAALAAAQSAVLGFNYVPNPITDGQAQAITYHTNDTTTPVTIILKQGPSTNLQTVETLTTDAHNGQFIWTPSTSIPDGLEYALEIQQGSQINYFGPFQIQGASPSASLSMSGGSSAMSSSTVSANGTASTTVPVMSGTGGSGMATGTAMLRNTTMSSATLSSSAATTTGSSGATTTAPNTSGAGFQSATSAAASASSTGNAASPVEMSSALSLVFGIAAAIFLH